jgi:hypothetical protein
MEREELKCSEDNQLRFLHDMSNIYWLEVCVLVQFRLLWTICGLFSVDYEDYCLAGCDAV